LQKKTLLLILVSFIRHLKKKDQLLMKMKALKLCLFFF
jgi:hypothetical protein